jgi:methylmalonyl-CoA mutase cobalamin-binding domain/chain
LASTADRDGGLALIPKRPGHPAGAFFVPSRTNQTLPYAPRSHRALQAQKPRRIVTAAALFDGHDAAINIMRRIIQSSGAEVIHLGHNRSVQEIVDCAIQEDAQAIAITSYQGGHNEYFKYMHDLLKERGAGHIKIFGGGGGVILALGNRGADGLRHRPHLLARRWPRHGPAGHD